MEKFIEIAAVMWHLVSFRNQSLLKVDDEYFTISVVLHLIHRMRH